MGNILRLYLEIAKEAERLTLEGLEREAALRKAKEIFGIKKEVAEATKNKINNCKDNITDIERKYNIELGQVYSEATGENIEIDPELIRDKLEEI